MQISPITDSNFKGKIKFDKKLSKAKIDYVNKILDFPLENGKTLKKRISKTNYDIEVFSKDIKNVSQESITLYSHFKTLPQNKKYGYFKVIKLNNGLDKNVVLFDKFLDKFEYDKNQFYYSYTSFGEKIKKYFKRLFR